MYVFKVQNKSVDRPVGTEQLIIGLHLGRYFTYSLCIGRCRFRRSGSERDRSIKLAYIHTYVYVCMYYMYVYGRCFDRFNTYVNISKFIASEQIVCDTMKKYAMLDRALCVRVFAIGFRASINVVINVHTYKNVYTYTHTYIRIRMCNCVQFWRFHFRVVL